jgi:Flp pilus assembly protein TadD
MRIVGTAHDARSGFRGPRHVRRRYPWHFHVHERLLWVLSLCVALIMRRAAARVATFSARVASVEQFVTAPVVEIAFPPHDHVHSANDILIEIALRRELLRQPRHRQHHVCVGMETLAVPEDVPFDDASGRPTEHCYLANEEPTSAYTITGLLPGARYSVSVALVHGGDQVVGLSMRSFQVASITRVTDTNEVVRMSIADSLRMARDLHLDDDRTGAVAIYREVLKMFPRHAEALHRLGQAQYQDGQALRAVELIRQAIDIDASDAAMYVSLALCLKALGRTDDAVAAFRTALVLRPSYAYAAMGLGSMLRAMDKWDEALHEFRKVVSTWKDPSPVDRQILEPPHDRMVVEALAWVCEILRLTDGLYEAERCLSHATKGFPDEVRFHIDRGHLLLYGGQFESAQREYEAASRLGSVHAMVRFASIYFHLIFLRSYD